LIAKLLAVKGIVFGADADRWKEKSKCVFKISGFGGGFLMGITIVGFSNRLNFLLM